MSGKSNRQVFYHLLFWALYVLLWGARDLVYHPDLSNNVTVNFLFSLFIAPFVYFNILYLVPRYLLRQKWVSYAVSFGLLFLAMFLTRYYAYQWVFRSLIGAMEAAEQFSSANGYVILFSENVVITMVSMALYLIKEYYGKEKYAHELEQKNMESELNMLKAQLQPHFLFNNLNTIYFLMETDTALAKEVMIQFSDVLSHQLYNAKKDKVPLKEELESLKSFLKIQEVRHIDFLELKYRFSENTNGLQIAPMILLTFIENAFKHGQREEGYKIDILVEVEGQDLQLRVVNSIGASSLSQQGGIGLENVQRRLNLLYPNRHRLEIERTKETYAVDLHMKLEANGEA